MKLYAPSTIRALQEKHGFRLSKRLGQNFLTDQHIIDKIIAYSNITDQDLVIEIGPGMGALTAAAAERGGKVIAIEVDSKLIPILQETLEPYENVQLVCGDILKTDLHRLIANNSANGVRGVKILGNLPYYITTPILMKLLEDRVPADSITIMMQKEVADRIQSPPGKKAYGALSVAVQYYCEVERVATVSKEVFIPAPKVDSAILRLDIRKEKLVSLTEAQESLFFRCVKAGFGQRRKTLCNALNALPELSKEQIQDILHNADIAPTRRAETLSIAEFAALAKATESYGTDTE